MKTRPAALASLRKLQPTANSSLLVLCLSVKLALQLGSLNITAGPAAPTPRTSQATLGVPSARSQPTAQPAKAAAQHPMIQSGAAVATNHTIVPVDTGLSVLGGYVYSTGSDDIILKVLTPAELPYPPERVTTIVNRQRFSVPNPNVSAWIDEIAIIEPGPARALATNKQYNRTMNLGRLPAGEVVFAIRTPDGLFKTGEGARNPDGQPHAVVKTFASGIMQVWFEDQAGSKLPATDRDFNDAVFQLSGGVANNNAVAELTKVIKEQQGQARQQAIEALRQINPNALLLALQP